MTIALTIAGALLILVALRDMFHQLFHPGASGAFSRWLMAIIWRCFRLVAVRNPKVLHVAGPVTLLGVIGSWTLLLVAGWALIYYPHLPDAFRFSSGMDPQQYRGWVTAFYISVVTLVTLGYGDITPTAGWLRLLAPVQALVGFALLSAGVSWVLSLYPVLARRRSFSQEVALLREAESASGVSLVSQAHAADQLHALASRLVMIRGDLLQFPVTYYFHTRQNDPPLFRGIPYLWELAACGKEKDQPEAVRLAATMLALAIDQLAQALAAEFAQLKAASTMKVFARYAEDHACASEPA